ncbi:MAG: phosphatase PAP2 family protein [Treponemataceae bacterium]
MDEIYAWGLAVIRWMQSVQNPVITTIVIAVTFLGDPFFVLLVLLAVFWCIDQKKGFTLGFLVIFNASIAILLKNFFKVARPYQLDESVGLITTSSFSTPSGHAQISLVLYVLLAYFFYSSWKTSNNLFVQKNARFLLVFIAIVLPFLIGLSRIYLGVHFPTDVFLGWIAGALIILAGISFCKFLQPFYVKIPQTFQILLLACLIFLLNALSPHDRMLNGALFGFSAGYIYLLKHGGFNANSLCASKKLFRFFIGCFGVGIIGFAVQSITIDPMLTFALCFFLGLWISYLSPMLFVRWKLALPESLNAEAL